MKYATAIWPESRKANGLVNKPIIIKAPPMNSISPATPYTDPSGGLPPGGGFQTLFTCGGAHDNGVAAQFHFAPTFWDSGERQCFALVLASTADCCLIERNQLRYEANSRVAKAMPGIGCDRMLSTTAFAHRLVILRLAVSAAAGFLSAMMNRIYSGPGTLLGFLFRNTAVSIAFFDMLGLAFS